MYKGQFRYNDFLAKNNHLRAGFSFGGRAWQTGSLAYRYAPNEQWQIQLSGSATRRPDGRFFGIGSQANEDLESEYGYLGASGALTTQGNFWRQSNLRIGVGYRRTEFHSDVGSDVDDISIEDRFEAGQFDALPPGYSDGISVLYQSAKLTIDTRRARPAPGSGLRVTAGYELAFDARHPGEQLWINYGGSVGAYVDVSGSQNVLGLQLSFAVADSINGDVPFTELPALSGNGPMRGFLGRFLVGQSHAALLADYHWPVWNWLDATVHVAVGNVYDGKFENFSIQNQRLSFGVGLAAVDQRDHFFEFLVGFGTDTFENGPDVQSVRVMFGGVREF